MKKLLSIAVILSMVMGIAGIMPITVSAAGTPVSSMPSINLAYFDEDDWVTKGSNGFTMPSAIAEYNPATTNMSKNTRVRGAFGKPVDDSSFIMQTLPTVASADNYAIFLSAPNNAFYELTTAPGDVILFSYDFATSGLTGDSTDAGRSKILLSGSSRTSYNTVSSGTWFDQHRLFGNGQIQHSAASGQNSTYTAEKWYNVVIEIGGETGSNPRSYKLYIDGVLAHTGESIGGNGNFLSHIRAGIKSSSGRIEDMYFDNLYLNKGEPFSVERYYSNRTASALSFIRHIRSGGEFGGTDTQNAITEDLILPENLEFQNLAGDDLDGTVINWASTNPAVIDPATGVVTRGANDENVTLTATVTSGTRVNTKTFDLTVLANANSAVELAREALNFDIFKDANTAPDSVTTDLNFAALTTWATNNNINPVTWISSEPTIIDPVTGIVNLGLADQTVILTATITDGTTTTTKQFLLNVLKDRVLADRSWLVWDIIRGTNAINAQMSITDNLTLPMLGENGSVISWSSDNAVISISGTTGTIMRSLTDANVKLTATISQTSFTQQIKEFDVMVLRSETALAAGAITFDSIKAGNIAESMIDQNLVDLSAIVSLHSTTIEWTASPEGIINTTTGEVTRSGVNKNVTLTATVTKDSQPEANTVFFLTVLGNDNPEEVAAALKALQDLYEANEDKLQEETDYSIASFVAFANAMTDADSDINGNPTLLRLITATDALEKAVKDLVPLKTMNIAVLDNAFTTSRLQSAPNNTLNHGGHLDLRTRRLLDTTGTAGNSGERSFLKFSIAGVDAETMNFTMRVFLVSGRVDRGYQLALAANNWMQGTHDHGNFNSDAGPWIAGYPTQEQLDAGWLTWASRPEVFMDTMITLTPAQTAGHYVDFDVTPLVREALTRGWEEVTIVFSSNDDNGSVNVWHSSRAENKPHMIATNLKTIDQIKTDALDITCSLEANGDTLTDVAQSLVLPSVDTLGNAITWTVTGDTGVMNNDGSLVFPRKAGTVILTGEIIADGITTTFSYTLNVKQFARNIVVGKPAVSMNDSIAVSAPTQLTQAAKLSSSVNIVNHTNDAKTVYIGLAVYSGEGQLIDMAFTESVVQANGNTTGAVQAVKAEIISLSKAVYPAGIATKSFVWDTSFKPIAEMFDVTYTP